MLLAIMHPSPHEVPNYHEGIDYQEALREHRINLYIHHLCRVQRILNDEEIHDADGQIISSPVIRSKLLHESLRHLQEEKSELVGCTVTKTLREEYLDPFAEPALDIRQELGPFVGVDFSARDENLILLVGDSEFPQQHSLLGLGLQYDLSITYNQS